MPPQPVANGTPQAGLSYAPQRPPTASMDSANHHHAYPSNPAPQQGQLPLSSSSAAAAVATTTGASSVNAPKKRTHKGTEKKRRKEVGPEGSEKSPRSAPAMLAKKPIESAMA
ncbi:unnamed protein product [Mortierella alpina]